MQTRHRITIAYEHLNRNEINITNAVREAQFFSSLRAAGYDCRVSIEGRCDDFADESRRSLKLLRKLSVI